MLNTVTVVSCDNANLGFVKLQKVPKWFLISSVNSGRSKLSLYRAPSGLPALL